MEKLLSPGKAFRYLRLPSLIVAISLFYCSCDRYPDAGISTEEYYTFNFFNLQERRLNSQDTFPETVLFYVGKASENDDDSVFVDFSVKGGGTLSKSSGYVRTNSELGTKWRLGTSSLKQVVRASSYNLKGEYLTSTELVAYGFRKDTWDTLKDVSPECRISGIVADTVAKKTFIIAQSNLYVQGSRYFDWNLVSDPNVVSPRTIEADTNNVIYISTWNGEVVKSTDHGTTWIKCAKPFPDNPYYVYLEVANDNWLWAYKYEEKNRYSSDGGATWHDAGAAVDSAGFGNTVRLKDGTLLHIGAMEKLIKSTDNGATWSPLACPRYSTQIFVTRDNKILIYSQESGFTIYRSVDNAATFQNVATFWTQFGTSYENHFFTKIGEYYYIPVHGYGIVRTKDFLAYTDYWRNWNLLDLFIDHNGVFIGKDWDYRTIYYRKNSVK
ncbi:MAG: sialidase family protein [Bacteroidales bacterium]